MQSRNEKYDYAARAEIQVARLLSAGNRKGSNWTTPPAYQISVLNFEFDKDDNSPLTWYTMRNQRGMQLAGRLNVLFFDLVKILRWNAKEALNMVSQDEINWARENSIFIAQRDYNEGMYQAEKRGMEKAKIETAKNALALNLPLAQVEKITGLSVTELKKL